MLTGLIIIFKNRVNLQITELAQKVNECQRALCILNLMGTEAKFAGFLRMLCLFGYFSSGEWRPMFGNSAWRFVMMMAGSLILLLYV